MENETGVIFGQSLPGGMSIGNFDLASAATKIPGSFLFYILIAMAILMGGVTLVLYYHWMRYSFGDRKIFFAQVFYTLVLLLAFIVMINSAILYA